MGRVCVIGIRKTREGADEEVLEAAQYIGNIGLISCCSSADVLTLLSVSNTGG